MAAAMPESSRHPGLWELEGARWGETVALQGEVGIFPKAAGRKDRGKDEGCKEGNNGMRRANVMEDVCKGEEQVVGQVSPEGRRMWAWVCDGGRAR